MAGSVGRSTLTTENAQQGVVAGSVEGASAMQPLVLKFEERRLACRGMVDVVIAALPQHAPEQKKALRRVKKVLTESVKDRNGKRRSSLFRLLPGQKKPHIARHAAGPSHDLGSQLKAARFQFARKEVVGFLSEAIEFPVPIPVMAGDGPALIG